MSPSNIAILEHNLGHLPSCAHEMPHLSDPSGANTRSRLLRQVVAALHRVRKKGREPEIATVDIANESAARRKILRTCLRKMQRYAAVNLSHRLKHKGSRGEHEEALTFAYIRMETQIRRLACTNCEGKVSSHCIIAMG